MCTTGEGLPRHTHKVGLVVLNMYTKAHALPVLQAPSIPNLR